MSAQGKRVAIPADQGLVEVPEAADYQDSETVSVYTEQLGQPVDGPDHPRTIYATATRLRDHDRLPIVPAWMRNKREAKAIARQVTGMALYVTGYHATRTPKYAARLAFRAPIGAYRSVKRTSGWALDWEARPVRAAAIRREDAFDHAKLTKMRNDRVRFRVTLVLLGALALAVLFAVARVYAPSWAAPIAGVLALLALGWHGAPADRPITDRVHNGPRFVKLTAEQVRAALCVLGISAIREPSSVTFPQDIHRDGPGWLARVNLPAGVEAVEVLEKRGKLSSALRLPVDQVWPSAGPDHAGQLDLWVGYQPASKMGQPKWSLAASNAQTSVFDAHEFGTDQRQRPVKTVLFARNFLIGGVPGSGKSYGARTLATIAALDPTAELKIVEYKGTGDFSDLAHLCTTYACGVGDAEFATGLDMLNWGLAEAERRGKRIEAAKKRGDAPEGKVTPALAAKPGSGLHPVLIVIDEAHELFGDSTVGKEAAKAAERLIKRGRALGIIVVLSTQIPDAKSLPSNITKCVTVRWCLAVQDQVANDQILGTGAYKRGMSATVYRPGIDAGWGIVTGIEQSGPVRSHFPDPATAAAIVARATELRGGAVVGGQADAQQRRDILDDVLHVVAERLGMHWDTVAERLAQLDPAYDGITAEIVSARLRALQIPSVDVKADGLVRKGVRREAVAEAQARKVLTAR